MAGKPVVVGMDGSQESFRAVEWAAREAVLHQTALRIVSVRAYPPQAVPGWATSGMLAQLTHRAAERALAVAAERATEMAPGLVIETSLLPGSPAQVLAGTARDAFLLVVGTRGAGGFSALVLGSVCRYVATHALCPVVVARQESMVTHREIVVGVDGPGQSAAALGFAFEEAALRKARLLVVHAVLSFPAAIRALVTLTGAERAALGQRDRLAGAAVWLDAMLAGWKDKYPQVQTGVDVTDAHPGQVLAGESARADLVVLGRHTARGPRGSGVGSVTHAVLSHAHGPVASVPATGEDVRGGVTREKAGSGQ
ncbi:MAG TPA: universal stress protein [Streptosporangiaceae bacterium]|nr:universal stress protein [Streptosporangiaceae bacterium]